MGNCLTPCCVDGSTLEHLPPEKSTLEHLPTENSILEHPPPEKSRLEHPPPENSTLEHPSSENSTLEHPPPEKSRLEHPPPENSTLEQPPSENSTLEHPPPENSTPDTAATSLDTFDVHGEDDLKRLLDYIDQTLQARQRSTARNEASKTITSNTNNAATLLDRVTTRCKSAVNSDVSKEAYQILSTTLGTVGNLHWITAGLSIVALILNRMDMTGANLKQGLSHLETLQDLGRHIVNLYPQFPRDNDALRRATSFIVEGGIICCTHLASGSLKSSFAALKERIPEIRQDLSLACDVELQRRISMPLAATIAEFPNNAVGLDDKISKVLEMLGMSEGGGKLKSGVRAVDLHGIGGIGKSTIGSAVHAKLCFQGCSHVRVEVGENPLDEKICNLQTQILERILNQKFEISDCMEGRQKLKQGLKKSKDPCMFFIDNIFHPKDLNKLLPDQLNEVLPDDSRIIITSRPHSESISQVLSKKGVYCEKYDVPELSHAHAQTLLCKEIFSSITFPVDKQDRGKCILKMCGGLPLALEVVGGYLRQHKDDDAIWDSAIKDLGNCLPLDGSEPKEYELTRALEFGYNKLRPEFQNAFLDIACLLRNLPWDFVKSRKRELENLEKWGLVKKSVPVEEDNEVGSEREAVVHVHDLLVALAQRKQREEVQRRFPEAAAQYPELVLRILLEHSSELPFPLRDEDDESLRMLLEGVHINNSPVQILAEKLNAMQKLRILILSGVKVQGNYTNISKRLQVCVYEYWKKDWDDSPYVIGQLPTGCEDLYLKSLNFVGFLPQAFPEKSSLHELSIVECDGFQELPKDFLHLIVLKKLDLTSCRSLRGLPANFERLRALESLVLNDCCDLMELPNGFGRLAALRQLDLRRCTSLTKLPDDFGSLDALESLDLVRCIGLIELPKRFEGLIALKSLKLHRCEGLLELPKGFGGLAGLPQLDLSRCTSIQKLPDDFGNLSALESLDLARCEGLTELPKGFGRLTTLKSLELCGCKGLLELPKGFGGLAALQQLDFSWCTSLTKLPDDFGSLGALQQLNFSWCKSLTKLPNDFGSLGALESLDLHGCKGILELPKGFGGLAALRQLHLSWCTSLTKLPDDFGNMGGLECLDLESCEGLTELPKGFGGLAALRHLDLPWCTSLTKLPNDFGNLGPLDYLDLSGCKGLIDLESGEGLTELPKGFKGSAILRWP